VIGSLVAEKSLGNGAELIVHKGRQRIDGTRLALLPAVEQLRDFPLSSVLQPSGYPEVESGAFSRAITSSL
jgi:hypothetical protein